MPIEYEAVFIPVDPAAMRRQLKELGAKLIYPERQMTRYAFSLPEQSKIQGAWLRVRDEGDKITLTYKQVSDEHKIECKQELEIEVSDFETAAKILETIGCRSKAYQETRREKWHFMDCDVTIDFWPFLDPMVEVEGADEATVKAASAALGLDYAKAHFGSVDSIYAQKYGITKDRVCNHTPRIAFDMQENPFL